MGAHGSMPSAVWCSYRVSSDIRAESVSPVVANAVAVDTPISPGQIIRSRLAPSTRTERPSPHVAELFQPWDGGGHVRPCVGSIEQSCTVYAQPYQMRLSKSSLE